MNEQEFAELAAGHALNALSHEDEARYWQALAAHPEWEPIVRADAATAAALADGVERVAPPLTARSMLLVRVAALAREQGAVGGDGAVAGATDADAHAADLGDADATDLGDADATDLGDAGVPGTDATGLGDAETADADATDADDGDTPTHVADVVPTDVDAADAPATGTDAPEADEAGPAGDAPDSGATQVLGMVPPPLPAAPPAPATVIPPAPAPPAGAEAPDSPRTDTTPTTMTGLFRWATVDTSPAPVQPASSSDGVDEPPTTTTVQAVMRRRWTRGLLALAACLTLLAGVGFGAGVLHTWLNRPASVVALDEINDAPDARSATVVMEGGLTATAYWSAERGEAVLVSEGLPTIPDDETFELWVIRDDEPLSAGTFEPEAGSRATTVVEGEVQPGDVIAVTVEPAGGAPGGMPTSDPIVAVPTA
ncbi:anti-sigma factor [Microbacterium jiangjiandongii]|uniref:anti-sigma factor n=1 Tax=Microbacterium jiangjiandongii TaxID=3049071 RepID=UPI0027D8AAE2|nr:anti-sigma factor [Microbacterium sp. zg.Y843]